MARIPMTRIPWAQIPRARILTARIFRPLPMLAACLLAGACGSLTLQPNSTKPLNGMDTTMGTYPTTNAARYIIVTMTDTVHEQLVRGERIDKEAELPPLYASFIGNLARTYGLKRVADWPLNSIDIRCLVFEVLDTGKRDATIAALAKENFVETVQPVSDFFTGGNAVAATADSNATGYDDPYSNMQPALQMMQIAESHRWATGRGVRVAVVDTGMDVRHPELRERVTGVRNFVDRDSAAFNADVHGTAVAGVIAAPSNNGVGFVGVAPEAEIIGLKACWQLDGSSRARCNSFTLAKALNFAIDQQVDIINLSLGGPPDPLLARLIAKALEREIVVIGAVHPDWSKGFPGAVEGVIAVSNAQAGDDDSIRPIRAPGDQILSAKPNNDYDFYTGSSFAAAQISGVTALIRQRKPHLSGEFVKELIAATSQDGRGTANACRAVARVVGDVSCQTATALQTSGR